MALVFRKNQNVPLSNSQLDGNFEFLRDQLTLKANTADLTAEYISTRLNTPAIIEEGSLQTETQLAETNALNAWKLRSISPSFEIPGGSNKTSIPLRGIDGEIRTVLFIGNLDGNAASADTADSADVALSLSNTYTVPVERGGTAANTKAAARASLEVLHTGGTNVMTAKLKLAPSSGAASLGFGVGGSDPLSYEDGDMWSRSDGLYYRIGNANHKIAPTDSPIFSGQPKAPNVDGTDTSQIATISHINAAVTTLNAAIVLKSNINSPAFTGTPTAPTADQTVINTRVATTQYVHTAVNNKATVIETEYKAYTDGEITDLQSSINTLLAAKAALDSPALTGTPTSTTPARGNSSTRIATTEFTADALEQLNQSVQAALTSLTALVNSTRPVPAGSVFYIASNIVPNGYFEANGQVVSRLTYPTLWAAMGSPATTAGDPANTFRIPDLRGEFIRGWDDGRGRDPSRVLLSTQAESIDSHTHNFYDVYAIWGDQPGNYNLVNGNPTYPGGSAPAWYSGLRDVDGNLVYQYFYLTDASDGDYDGGAYAFKNKTLPAGTGSEIRPRNVALMPIIKY